MSTSSSLEKDKTPLPENVCQGTADVAAETSNSSTTEGSREAQAASTDRPELPHKAAAVGQSSHGEAVSNTLLPSPRVPAPPSQTPTDSGQTSLAPIQGSSTSSVSPRVSLPKGLTTPAVLTTARAVGPTPPRTPAPKSTMVMVRPPQTASVQLPATFQIPPGMVLVRSDSGQLMLVSQQALAQAQKAVSNTSLVQPSAAPAVRKPASAPVIRVCLPVSAPKPPYASGPGPQRPPSSTGPSVQRPSAMGKVSYRPSTAAVDRSALRLTSAPGPTCATGTITQRPTCATGTTAQRPTSATGTITQRSTSATGTITQRPTCTTGTIAQRPGSAIGVGLQSASSSRGTNPQQLSSTVGTTHQLISCTTVKAKDVTPVSRPGGLAPRVLPANIPTQPKATPPGTPTPKTMENVKKCKNFLVTLMKLASSSSHSSDMGMNVRNLVKSLLDGKLEPEEFTDKLYMELKSSPQPYLVTFLKRSLPAVRQLTPDSELFIRQCEQTGAQTSTATSTQPPLSSSLRTPEPQTAKLTSQNLGIQPQQVVTTKKPMALKHVVLGRGVSKLQTTRTLTSNIFSAEVIVRPSVQITKCQSASSLPNLSVKESGGGGFRDEDDINDVASMAGVSVSEERARILATGAESVGLVIRSCRDEPFLCPAALHSRITHTALSRGVTGLEGDVVGLVSGATEERLRELLGKLTVTAQHRHMQLKECCQYQQVTDVRGQLRFLEHVETLQQQRKEEEEREMLLRIVKSRSGNAELQCLKQKAREMQQLELAQAQHQQANLAALAAIGPRRKRPLEGTSLLGLRSAPRPVTRVTLRDLIFCMEQDAHLSRSLLLYSAMK